MALPTSTSRRPRTNQVDYELVHTRAPEVLRLYHRNITQNHRRRQPAKIVMPSIVSRAQLIVEQRSFLPVATTKVDT